MEYERQFAMIMKDVEYRSGGQRFVGFLAVDETITGRRPGLLICHGGAGLDDETKDNARRIAELGYVAYALDVIGDGQVLDESSVTPRVAQLRSDPPRLRAVGLAGLDVLRKQPEVAAGQLAAIGYCFGGLVALELARAGTDLKAVIGFHSRLTSLMPQEPVRIAGKVLVCLGAEDPVIPPAERSAFEDEMNSARVNWQMNIYGGAAHAFTSRQPRVARPLPERFQPLSQDPWIGYHEQADIRSWRAMRELLNEVFGPEPANGR